jgi:hypothetical protein
MKKEFYFETGVHQIDIKKCPFCGRLPEFVVTGRYTRDSLSLLGANIKFGCAACDVYPRSSGHLYNIEFIINPNNMSGIRCVKDERLDLIDLWNKRSDAGDVGGDI